MAGESSYQKPSNSIVVAGEPIVTTKKVAVATTMYAGRLVMKGTDPSDAVVCTAGGAAIGWLGYEQTLKKYRPATVDTIFVVDSQAPILNGPGVVLVASLPAGQTIVHGDRLVAGASGQLTKASAAKAAAGGTAVTAHTAAPEMVGPIPTEGIVVAIAEEDVTSGGGDADIMVRSMI
jgi:hypothetical protein